MLRNLIEAAVWLAIIIAYTISETRRHRALCRKARAAGEDPPPPYQW